MNSPLKSRRNGYFDAVRGIAIVLVVIGHASAGIGVSGLISTTQYPFFSALNSALYLVHLPLLALLMGVNIPLAVSTRHTGRYLLSRVYFFLFLYLVWTAIQGAFSLLGSSFANEPTTLSEILNLAKPQGHLWFMPWATIASTFALILSPWKSLSRTIVALTLTGIIAILGWGINGTYIGQQGNALYIFLILGATIGPWALQNVPERLSNRNILPSLVITLVGFFVLLLNWHLTKPTSGDPTRTVNSIALGITGSVFGSAMVLAALAIIYKKGIALSWAEHLGQKSLQIYLAHLLFTPTTRVILVKIGLENPFLVLIAATVAGVVFSLIMDKICSKIAPWLFTPPAMNRIAPKIKPRHIKDA